MLRFLSGISTVKCMSHIFSPGAECERAFPQCLYKSVSDVCASKVHHGHPSCLSLSSPGMTMMMALRQTHSSLSPCLFFGLLKRKQKVYTCFAGRQCSIGMMSQLGDCFFFFLRWTIYGEFIRHASSDVVLASFDKSHEDGFTTWLGRVACSDEFRFLDVSEHDRL